MAKHTPGPWGVYLDPETNQFEVFHDEGRGYGRRLAEVVGERGRFEGNARLIAAAPELLAACEAELEVYDGMDAATLRLETLTRIAALRAAVAKARGEAIAEAASLPTPPHAAGG